MNDGLPNQARARGHCRLCSIIWLAWGTMAFAQSDAPKPAAEPTRRPGLKQDAIDNLSRKHPGYLGALAPENLAKKRPKAPFDLTGTWFVDLRGSFEDFKFGPPYPQFHEAGRQALQEAAAARQAGRPYRDSIGQCYPAGMPMIMTRVWPISMMQAPTVIFMMFNFTNSLRIIYLDGRGHTDPDIAEHTYNGESIGHWEKDTLVVHTKYFETHQHWIDEGIPVSDQFEIVERIRLLEKGTLLQIEYTMTDPKNWQGGMEEHEALDAGGLQRHLRSRVPAEPQQGSAEHCTVRIPAAPRLMAASLARQTESSCRLHS